MVLRLRDLDLFPETKSDEVQASISLMSSLATPAENLAYLVHSHTYLIPMTYGAKE